MTIIDEVNGADEDQFGTPNDMTPRLERKSRGGSETSTYSTGVEAGVEVEGSPPSDSAVESEEMYTPVSTDPSVITPVSTDPSVMTPDPPALDTSLSPVPEISYLMSFFDHI